MSKAKLVHDPSLPLIQIVPRFLLDDPVQGVVGWEVRVATMPRIIGSKRQVYWATDIRGKSMQSFIELMMHAGDERSLINSHYWTPDLQQQVRDIQYELNTELGPLIAQMTQARDWINALDYDHDNADPGVIARLLGMPRRQTDAA